MSAIKQRKVLIGTPSYDGRLDVFYVNSLLMTKALCPMTIDIRHTFLSFDALIQRARNDIIAQAIHDGFDDLIFIDSDMEWDPRWIFSLLNRSEQVVGGTARKKTDSEERYAFKAAPDLYPQSNGLLKVSALGTGFVRIGRKALKAAWDASEEYENEGKKCRMVCNVEVIDGQLYSEDTALFRKLTDAGFPSYLDPKMTCNHIGSKKFCGNAESFIERVRAVPNKAVNQ